MYVGLQSDHFDLCHPDDQGRRNSDLTFAAGGVEGLVGLDEDEAGLEGHHHHLLQRLTWEVSLQVDVLLDIWVPVEVFCRDLSTQRKEIKHKEQGQGMGTARPKV